MAIELKSILNFVNEDYKFIIPSFQRGYRWRPEEVKNLLDDINDFLKNREKENESEVYCLQSLVLKKDEKSQYKVIDGQQRLTTLKLVLSILGLIQSDRFLIKYESREKSEEYLNSLCSTDNQIDQDFKNNIDFHFMRMAKSTIQEWFSRTGENYIVERRDDFLISINFIWYETTDENIQQTFLNINSGKILYYDFELIKGELLIKSGDERLRIAERWNTFEFLMMEDTFFFLYFKIEERREKENRLDKLLGLYLEEKEPPRDFSYYQKFRKNSETGILKWWDEFDEFLTTLEEIYRNRELYHLAGFLLKCRDNLGIKEVSRSFYRKNKNEFKKYLKDEVKKRIGRLVNIKDLRYGKDNKYIYNVLYFFNILTYYENHKYSLFPFEIFSTHEKVDIEHIRPKKPQAEEYPNYLKIILKNLIRRNHETNSNEDDTQKKDLIGSINDFLKKINQDNDEFSEIESEFDELYYKILGYFCISEFDENINDKLSNLALLNRKINRGYRNLPFHIKRLILLKKRKMVHPSTLDIFLKVYSRESMSHTINYWSESDAENYEQIIFNIISQYLGEIS